MRVDPTLREHFRRELKRPGAADILDRLGEVLDGDGFGVAAVFPVLMRARNPHLALERYELLLQRMDPVAAMDRLAEELPTLEERRLLEPPSAGVKEVEDSVWVGGVRVRKR